MARPGCGSLAHPAGSAQQVAVQIPALRKGVDVAERARAKTHRRQGLWADAPTSDPRGPMVACAVRLTARVGSPCAVGCTEGRHLRHRLTLKRRNPSCYEQPGFREQAPSECSPDVAHSTARTHARQSGRRVGCARLSMVMQQSATECIQHPLMAGWRTSLHHIVDGDRHGYGSQC